MLGMAILIPPHKVFNRTGSEGALAVSCDFRFPAIAVPYLLRMHAPQTQPK